ncbi:MAG: ATP-binding protein [bacterium]|jgi:signal transduction histidine kinase/ActR/RegA family two-component response regulator|nr:ATP-binding protein [Betaproteobacteria bacterium]
MVSPSVDAPSPVPPDPVATIVRLERRALRERAARREAEALLEARSQELYEANVALTQLAGSLEAQVEARTRELESAVARANEAARAKTNFLATMSHELRTPMNGVIGAAQLLVGTPLTPEQQGHAETIRASGELLLSIINDILDLSKIEAGHLVLESRPFDPRASLASIDSLLRAAAARRGIGFRVRVDDSVPDLLLGDDMRLRQVLLNLASNAVKFTSQGGVALRLAAGVPDGEGRVPVELTVADTGVGIPGDRMETIFEPFAQADASTAREYGGTGLGLAICRRIAALMEGSLEVHSEPGVGSAFRLRWRASVVSDAAATRPSGAPAPSSPSFSPSISSSDAAGASAAAAADAPALRILVAEDNEINRTIARALLGRLGLQAEVAEDGQVALDKVRDGRYDLVLMDMRMPRMDGLEATRRIRALVLDCQPRVVALTANAFEEDRQACLAAGMDGFLAKPYRLDDLARLVDDVRAQRVPGLA